jgi:hypothetical protein
VKSKTASKPEKGASIDKKKLQTILAAIDKPSQVRAVSISKLHLDPHNARVHTVENIEAIKRSILNYGQQKPIIVNKKGMILAGNGFFQAATELGLSKVQVVVSQLTGNMAKAYAISDNRTGELSEFDNKILAGLMKEIYADQDIMDVLEGVIPGFSEAQQDNILALLDSEGKLQFQGGETADVELMEDTDGGAGDSHTRVIQLYVDGPQFDEYSRLVEKLTDLLGCDNSTDVVLTSLRKVYKIMKATKK